MSCIGLDRQRAIGIVPIGLDGHRLGMGLDRDIQGYRHTWA